MKKENVSPNIKNKAYYQGLKTKHINAAKDAAASGDRVLSEHNLQCAEHYTRIVNERFCNQQSYQNNQQQPQKSEIKPETKIEVAPELTNVEVLPKVELPEEIKNKTSVKKSQSPIRKKKPAPASVVESTVS